LAGSSPEPEEAKDEREYENPGSLHRDHFTFTVGLVSAVAWPEVGTITATDFA
jgi:hypothetical protein